MIKQNKIYPISLLTIQKNNNDFTITKILNNKNILDNYSDIRNKYILYKNLKEIQDIVSEKYTTVTDIKCSKELIDYNHLILEDSDLNTINLKKNIENIFKIGNILGYHKQNFIFPVEIIENNVNKVRVKNLTSQIEVELEYKDLCDWYAKYNVLDSVSFIEDEKVYWIKNILFDIKNRVYLYNLDENADLIDEILIEKSY